MSSLFYAGQAKRTSGTFTVTMRNGAKLAKKLEKLKDGGETAIKYTVSDFTARAPGWVTKGIRRHYGVDTAAINDAGPKTKRGGTSTNVAGIVVDGVSLKYEGKTLTPTHFNMNYSQPHPKGLQTKRVVIPGQKIAEKATNKNAEYGMVRTPVPYQIKATIIKGHRATMKGGTYIAPSNSRNAGAPNIPFQRTPGHKFPVEAIHTLSVPQMIGNEEHPSRASETINNIISENIEKRFNNHIKRVMK